jgi:UDP-N-acetylglucosamine/UDP-N-acetylgalactosamine diphosphorylase
VLAPPAAATADGLDPLGRASLAAAFEQALALRSRPPRELAPAPVLGLEATAVRAEAVEAGEALLAAGSVAALVVAGGQATRLGRPGPKGLFPIGPVTGRTLFALYAQKLRRIERRFGRRVPWIVMTSEATDAATRAYFDREQCFGLEVHFIRQREAPCVDFTGRPLLSAPGVAVTAPDGHGGVLWALSSSGTLARLADAGIRALAYHQVDNPLAH